MIYGQPATSLHGPGATGWARNAGTITVGAAGEAASAKALQPIFAASRAALLHDVRIPGMKANIDHVVICGAHVVLLDSKMWKPGFYWTWRGHVMRGLHAFTPADRKTLPAARARYLNLAGKHDVNSGLSIDVRLVVWPSRPGKPISLKNTPLASIHIPGPALSDEMVRLIEENGDASPHPGIFNLFINNLANSQNA